MTTPENHRDYPAELLERINTDGYADEYDPAARARRASQPSAGEVLRDEWHVTTEGLRRAGRASIRIVQRLVGSHSTGRHAR